MKTDQIPVELLTSSASGLDPNISQESALLQVPRIAAATHVSQAALRELVKKNTHGRFLWVFGQPTVNVLDLNIRIINLQEG